MGTGNLWLYLLHATLELCLVYVLFAKEGNERKIYKWFFDYRDKLIKFKQLIQEYLPVGIMLLDPKNHILFSN